MTQISYQNEDFIREYLKTEKAMSDYDIEDFINVYRTLSIAEISELIYEMVGKDIYREKPVDIETFLYDPYYLGTIYGDNIFKTWDDLLKEIYPAPFCKKYEEVILSCGTRVGKTTVTAISLSYEIYLMMCLKNAAKSLIGKNSGTICIATLSKDNAAAVSQLASDVYKILTLSPWFQNKINGDLAFSTVEKRGMSITDNLILKAGSTLSTLVGENLACYALDECNILTPKFSADTLVEKRLEIHMHAIDRRKSTLDLAVPMTGIMWLSSSPTEEHDVIKARIDQVIDGNIPNVKIIDNLSRWAVRGTKATETFDFFLGSDTKDPCILDDNPDLELTAAEYDNVIKVPRTIEYLSSFRKEPTRAIQEIAGRRTSSESNFFRSVNMFEKIFYKDNHIFSKDELHINMDGKLDFDDYLIDKDFFKKRKYDKPDCRRYIHLDVAFAHDKFGIASVYSDRVKFTAEDGTEISKRMYYVDFCLGIMSKNGSPVDIVKILEFLCKLKNEYGYDIALVTTDSKEGAVCRQLLHKAKFNVDYLSIERSKEPYFCLKDMIYSQSLVGFKNPSLVKELKNLKESEKKIDKPKSGNYYDDMAQALAGALWNCYNDKYYKKTNDTVTDLINNFKAQQSWNQYYGRNEYNF